MRDPYQVLGLAFGASDSEISKAYRNLARTLHPDKHVARKLTEAEQVQAAVRFHEIQIARSFLLDVDHAETRRKYDTQQASDQIRRSADKAKEVSMTERRKRMRDELKVREELAASSNGRKQQQASSSLSSARATANKDELARQGRELRERFADKAAAAELHERNQAALQRQERQIRLKWSRKKLKAAGHSSPSEDSIAKMLQLSCGGVEGVQMMGAKGNVALVTFHEQSSCNKAVEAYATSDIYRATHVGKGDKYATTSAQRHSSAAVHRDREDVNEWKVRQAAEREALLRQIEQVDDEASNHHENRKSSPARPIPSPFPSEYATLTFPLDKLEKAEASLLRNVVSEQSIQRMKVTR